MEKFHSNFLIYLKRICMKHDVVASTRVYDMHKKIYYCLVIKVYVWNVLMSSKWFSMYLCTCLYLWFCNKLPRGAIFILLCLFFFLRPVGKLENVNNLFDDAVTMVYSACLYVFVCVCIWFVRRRHLTMDGDESPHYFIYSISRSFWRCLLLLLSFRLLVFRCEDRVEKCANIRTSLWLSKFFDNPFQLCV